METRHYPCGSDGVLRPDDPPDWLSDFHIALLDGRFLHAGERRPLVLILTAVGVTLAFWGLLYAMGIYMTPGDFFYYLGWMSNDA